VNSVSVGNGDAVSVSWAMLPSTVEWVVQQGSNNGESQACLISGYNGIAVINQPINVVYQTQDLNGWPQLVVEVWDKGDDRVKGLLGCGSAWVPCTPGKHKVSIALWKPQPSGVAGLHESFIPSYYEISALRQLILNPDMRVGMSCLSTGTVEIELNVVTSNFDSEGVQLG
jgi:hypothetical protein